MKCSHDQQFNANSERINTLLANAYDIIESALSGEPYLDRQFEAALRFTAITTHQAWKDQEEYLAEYGCNDCAAENGDGENILNTEVISE